MCGGSRLSCCYERCSIADCHCWRRHVIRPLIRYLIRCVGRLVRTGRRWRLDLAKNNLRLDWLYYPACQLEKRTCNLCERAGSPRPDRLRPKVSTTRRPGASAAAYCLTRTSPSLPAHPTKPLSTDDGLWGRA